MVQEMNNFMTQTHFSILLFSLLICGNPVTCHYIIAHQIPSEFFVSAKNVTQDAYVITNRVNMFCTQSLHLGLKDKRLIIASAGKNNNHGVLINFHVFYL